MVSLKRNYLAAKFGHKLRTHFICVHGVLNIQIYGSYTFIKH